jgi:hypothetical protein
MDLKELSEAREDSTTSSLQAANARALVHPFGEPGEELGLARARTDVQKIREFTDPGGGSRVAQGTRVELSGVAYGLERP